MRPMIRHGAAVVALVLLVAACGDDPEASELPIDDGVGAASSCLEGTVDCNDTPFAPGEPQDGLPPDAGATGPPSGGGTLSVAGAVAAGDTVEATMVRGFYLDDGSGPMLCEVLAESFPPQCGGASIPMADASAIDPDSIQVNQNTSWTDTAVSVVGQIAGGVLIPTPISE